MGKAVAIVVGAGAGLGLGAALCRRFAEGDHHVFVAGRSAGKIGQVVRSIESKKHSPQRTPGTQRKFKGEGEYRSDSHEPEPAGMAFSREGLFLSGFPWRPRRPLR